MGALFGIIIIVAALIYVPHKLWSEATQDQQDIAKGIIILVVVISIAIVAFFILLNVILDASFAVSFEFGETIGYILIALLILGGIGFIIWLICKSIEYNSPEGIRKQIEEREQFNKTRTQEFQEFFKKYGYDIYPEGYKILAMEYRQYARNISIQEAYSWISKKASISIMLHGDKEFEEELGITTKDLPDSFTEIQRKFALRRLCAEKLGLFYYDNVNTDIINANLSQISECVRFAKKYYADILKEKAPRIKL